MSDVPVIAVHGIGNYQTGLSPTEAAAFLAREWQPRLARGYRSGGLIHLPVPRLGVAYYADLLADEDAQYDDAMDLADLSEEEAALAWTLLRSAGVPDPAVEDEEQGWATAPLRQALGWLAGKRSTPVEVLTRAVVAFVREVHCYLSHPERRRKARAAVADAVRAARPRVLLAHSLGSVVAYEALHAHPDLSVDLFVTLGSPLGLPSAVFDVLEPGPAGGRGTRPPGVGRWYNLADPGDLVAVPRLLGNRFPVDHHDEPVIGRVDFHTLGSYLAEGLTAVAIAPYAAEAG
ncbi:serine peptidase [Streptomyces sp. SYSU K21746]